MVVYEASAPKATKVEGVGFAAVDESLIEVASKPKTLNSLNEFSRDMGARQTLIHACQDAYRFKPQFF